MKVLSLWKGEILAPPRTKDHIAQEVADRHGISVADLKGPDRRRPIAYARHEAMWLMAEEVRPDGRPRWANADIGKWFNRDHTTVIHGRRGHAERNGLTLCLRPRGLSAASGWRFAA
jgi:chromosomal replication initiation ATPase DnaA